MTANDLEHGEVNAAEHHGQREGEEASEAKTPSRGPGGRFFVVDRAVWRAVVEDGDLSDQERLHRMLTFLTLAAGTGGDQVTTAWSAKSVETYTGIARSKAQGAIRGLLDIACVPDAVDGRRKPQPVLAMAPGSTAMRPRYLIAKPAGADPIWLPVGLVTGLAGEASMCRRIREAGDWRLLKLLIDCYAAVETDATYGLPLAVLRRACRDDDPKAAEKIIQAGPHAAWAVDGDATHTFASSALMAPHKAKAKDGADAYAPFWARMRLLEQIGALVFEPWLCDGVGDEAQPLFPVARDLGKALASPRDAVDRLTELAYDAADALVPDRATHPARDGLHIVPMPAHHRAPTIQHVARLRVEADTRGARMAYAQRQKAIETWTQAYSELLQQAKAGRLDQPIRTRGKAA